MTFQKQSPQSPADHPVVLVEDVPRAVTKVVEPAHRHAINLGDRRLKGLARLSGCQPSDRFNHLSMAFRTREAKPAAKRITKKVEALLAAVNDVCLLGMQRQTCFGDETFDFLKRQLRLLLTTTQDHKSSSPGEFHPQALTEPDVNLSAHPALIVRSQGEFRVTTT